MSSTPGITPTTPISPINPMEEETLGKGKNLFGGPGLDVSHEDAAEKTNASPSVLSSFQQKTLDEILTKGARITDSDLRDLLKLLISAFAQLNNTQRMTDLAAITGLVEAYKAKIDQMKTAAGAQYDAAYKQAVCQIVGGAFSMACSLVSLIGTGFNARKIGNFENNSTSFNKDLAKSQTYVELFKMLPGLGQSASGIISGTGNLKAAEDTYDKAEAERAQEQQNLNIELAQKMLDNNTSMKKDLMDALQQIIQFIQQLIQQNASTENSISQV